MRICNKKEFSSNKIGDHVLSLKFEPKQQKICILQQFSSNSHENSSMLSSINLEIIYISTKFEPKQKKICNLQQFSSNSHENSSMLGSINLEIYISLQNLSQNNRKFASCSNFLTILPRIYKELKCLAQ